MWGFGSELCFQPQIPLHLQSPAWFVLPPNFSLHLSLGLAAQPRSPGEVRRVEHSLSWVFLGSDACEVSPQYPKGTGWEQLSHQPGEPLLSTATLSCRWAGKEGRRASERGLREVLIFLVCPEPHRDDFCSQEKGIEV